MSAARKRNSDLSEATLTLPLGEFIEECEERNDKGKYDVTNLLGVNNQQEFCCSRANTTGIDFHPYKIVRKNCFAYNPARLDIGSIAKFDGDVCIVSTLYEVFRIRDDKQDDLSPEFLAMYFARVEFARYVGYKNWGSAREYFWIDAMKRVPVPVPPLAVQQKVVDVWRRLRKMKEENEALAAPLMQLCRSYLQDCKKKWPMKEIGPMIALCDERNEFGAYGVNSVRGVSIEKKIIPTKADMAGVGLKPYKLLKPQEFCVVPVTSRNGERISLAINSKVETYIVSSAYDVFRVTDKESLSPEYLYLLFHRPEFDRYARFNSWGSARESFSFSDMCRVKIPLPPIEVQQAVVDVYRCASEAKKIADEADRLSRDICPALVRWAAEGGRA